MVPGFPWLANLVKRAGFWLSENLSDGSKVDNNRRQVVYLLSAQAGMYARAHIQGEGERHRYVGFSLGHAADLSGCRERVVTRELGLFPESQRIVAETSKSACAISQMYRFGGHFVT